ncbi:unnamed protein product [Meganyctiphanes norvegica]|uniref:Uncharacterized protein n=1 Tax=Meganyctiphanes norvegica TaxID=48144 RepID=A0AAV2QHH9_MEGNR
MIVTLTVTVVSVISQQQQQHHQQQQQQQQQTTEATNPTTIKTPPPSTAATTATTTKQIGSPNCYNCLGCSSVDEGTTQVVEDEFMSCMTTLVLDSLLVIRGGSYEEHPDGECIGNTQTFSCWCTGECCNDKTIDY